MGYRRNAPTIELTFEDPQYEGLQMRMKSMSFGKALETMRMAEMVKGDGEVTALAGVFADHIVSWNLEDDRGVPIEPTTQALLELDIGFVMDTLTAWLEGLLQVSAPLAARSTGGEQSAVLNLPMARS
jgi:hypothetical protein